MFLRSTLVVVLLAVCAAVRTGTAQIPSLEQWEIHDDRRPLPPVVDPGPPTSPVLPPSDALVLFDGADLSQWEAVDGGPARWKVEDGYLEVLPGSGSIQTREAFGDVQLHLEWASPNTGSGQDSGNSGIYFMGKYEVQVLNSYRNKTYADGQAAAVYGQYPPLVNASRPPGQWQTYDIIFRRPRFDDEGRVLEPARITVLHNGVLVQDHVALSGPTWHYERPPYTVHPDALPLLLQDHGDPVRFRNIWIRRLPEKEQTL